MSECDYGGCRDGWLSVNEVRAAEDAANWRRLEAGEVVQAGDEYRNCWGWQSVPTAWCGQALGDGFWTVRRRISSAPQHRDLPEAVAELRERVAKIEEAMMSGSTWYPICDIPAPPPPPAPPQPAPVTPPWQRAKWDEALAIICDGGDWGRGNNFDHGVLGALVIWADKEMDRLTAERDAALRERDAAKEECERLRQSVRDTARVRDFWHQLCATREEELKALKARVAELEAASAAPPEPRGWLTEEEREAADHAADIIEDMEDDDGSSLKPKADALRAMLARSTPPRVKVPTWIHDVVRRCVIAAIREAGGEVAE